MEQKCLSCGMYKDISKFTTGMKTCKFCKWKERHPLLHIPDGWTEQEIYYTLQQIFDKEITVINDIAIELGKTLDDIINLIHTHLKIKNLGNKPIKVKVKCENCQKEFNTTICFMLSNRFNFCCHNCYSQFRSKYYVGSKSSVYTKRVVKCDYCGKELLVPQSKTNIKNKENINHNFCNSQCYRLFRKQYYVGNRLYNTGIKLSDEQKEKCRLNTVDGYSNGIFNRQTRPQKITNDILESLNIAYQNEKNFKYYALDNYLNDYNLGIEVMGDYFHANPLIYCDVNELNEMQKNDVIRDKRKATYLQKYYNLKVLYLWERDLLKTPEKCSKLIDLFITENGMLQNYQSYNYVLVDGKIKLNDIIINPYFIQNP